MSESEIETTSSIFCPNDWQFKQLWWFLGITETVLIALLMAAPDNSLLLPITASFGLCFLIIIPGILILRLLRLHELGISLTLIYTVASGIAFDIFIGLLANTFLPYFGISQPLRMNCLAITFGIAVPLTALLAYVRDRNYGHPFRFKIDLSILPYALFFLLLPLLAIFGAELVNSANNNVVLLILIPVLAAVPILTLSPRAFPEKLYPLAIISVGLSLMLHITLISEYISGHDISIEYQVFRAVEQRSLWVSTFPYHGYNSTLGITILPTVFSRLTGISGLQVLKVVMPAISALTPLIIYEILRRYLSPRIAVLTTFVPMFMFQYYMLMPQTVKNQLGWLFISTALLAFMSRNTSFSTMVLAVIFFFAGIASHYYSAYLACYLFLAGVIIMYIIPSVRTNPLLNITLLLVVGTMSWYMYTGHSVNFHVFVNLVDAFTTSLLRGFTDATAFYGINLLVREELTPARLILKYHYLALQVLIVLGFSVYFIHWIRRKSIEFSKEYMAFSLASAILFVSVVIPGVSAYTDINRTFSLTIVFLVPFAFYGILTVVNVAAKSIKLSRRKSMVTESVHTGSNDSLDHQGQMVMHPTRTRFAAMLLMAIFTSSLLLFGSGWVSETQKDPHPLSWSLSRDRMHFPVYYRVELSSMEWLTEYRDNNKELYYDDSAEMGFTFYTSVKEIAFQYYGIGQRFALHQETPEEFGAVPIVLPETLEDNSYIYLSGLNLSSKQLAILVVSHEYLSVPRVMHMHEVPTFNNAITNANVIFDNGGSQIRLMR